MKAIFFPGNPGFPEDRFLLEKHLQGALNFVEGTETLLPGESYVAVTFSFGAYRLLKELEKRKGTLKAVILIAPFFRPDSPLPTLARWILSFPPTRRRIVAKKFPQWKADFVPKMFDESGQKLAVSYLQKLDSAKTWRQVIKDKLWQERKPLVSVSALQRTPVLILSGSKDSITPTQKIKVDCEALGLGSTIQEIPDAQHSLLWTHAETIARHIQSFLKPICSQE